MKTTLKVVSILCFFLIGSIAFAQKDKKPEYIVKPGVGTDKLQVGKTSLSDAMNMLGKSYNFSQSIADVMGGGSIYGNTYKYYDLGITVVFNVYAGMKDTSDTRLHSLTFERPLAPAKTIDGITIGVSTLKDITDVYGTPDYKQEYKNEIDVSYRYKGLAFVIDKADNKLEKITVFVPMRKTDTPNDKDTVEMMGQITRENFKDKGNNVIKSIWDYWFVSGDKKYFIKCYGSSFTKEMLDKWVGQSVDVKAVIKEGEWDNTGDPEKVQSRVGEYMTVIRINQFQ
jgi:hypothetical protein